MILLSVFRMNVLDSCELVEVMDFTIAVVMMLKGRDNSYL